MAEPLYVVAEKGAIAMRNAEDALRVAAAACETARNAAQQADDDLARKIWAERTIELREMRGALARIRRRYDYD